MSETLGALAWADAADIARHSATSTPVNRSLFLSMMRPFLGWIAGYRGSRCVLKNSQNSGAASNRASLLRACG
jgi:hypothetical protein